MSDGEIAAALLMLGALIGLHFEVFAVLLLTVAVAVGLATRGLQAGDVALTIVAQTVVGMMLCQGSYLLTAMLVSAKRRHVPRPRDGHHLP
jgi:predicted ABC-type exoprotein transport system permease subunit